ncbi:type II secretion system minor pseudopilin GspK [Undibacterium sp. 14-3-2]|uniref:type II secretion system minor pseudopilin GspK n=1 Tax=Undibacterium sp. 14-3-2 TaxID=2800129 RepID=UPI001905E327|nr:type II secretion system minor pseudopilin GspK [Undibacterium sp. 14-3-2]MBK1891569.1 type II secretion system minor pseudopilin GspK [Undibacterium sp. 14-3-2]
MHTAFHYSRQRGVAVVTALLLTTLAITIVASLFWQQQVQVRSIENQRMQLQKKWILRGAIDWARLILREDKKQSNVDHLGEPWAVRLEDTRLDQYVENGRADTDASDASLSGQVIDAQSLYNLNNLATDGVVDGRETAVFARLLTNLRFSGDLAQRTASAIAQSQPKAVVPKGAPDSAPASAPANSGGNVKTTSEDAQAAVQFLRFTQVDDLLSIPGYTPEMVNKLRSYVIALPRKSVITTINLNTAPAEVLAARIEGMSLSDAAMVVASRERAYITGFADFETRFPDKAKMTSKKEVDTSTNYFVVNGKVKMNRSLMDVSALIERAEDASTTVLWVRDN